MALPSSLATNTLFLDAISSLNAPNMMALNMSTTNNRRNRLPKSKGTYKQRMEFALFIRILLKRLSESGDVALRKQAQLLISSSVNRQRILRRSNSSISNNNNNSLRRLCGEDIIESIEVPLRELVGEEHWIRAHAYMRHYVTKKKKQIAATKTSLHFPTMLNDDQSIMAVAV